MSVKTGIEWTDSTWNPIRGVKGRHHCTKISPGCQNCYAAAMNKRFSGLDYVKGADTFRLDEKALSLPLIWRRPRKIFVCSMTDLFHEDIPDAMIDRVMQAMANSKHHTYQVLTKRPVRMQQYLSAWWNRCYVNWEDGKPIPVKPCPHIWFGVTAENQQYADERIPLLLQTPAAVRFVSYEPALGPLFLPATWTRGAFGGANVVGIDWLICGGESGPKARPMHPDWARSVRDQCQAAGVPFFFKQWGEFSPCERWIPRSVNVGESSMLRVGKNATGRLLNGREWNQFPKVPA